MKKRPDSAAIQAMVRQSLDRVLGESGAAPAAPVRQAAAGTITEDQLINVEPGTTLELPAGTLITPSARESALFRRIRLVEQGAPGNGVPEAPISHPPSGGFAAAPHRRVAIGADHGGFAMKQALIPYLGELGYAVEDCGPAGTDAVDYPDFAFATAALVSDGSCGNGIFVDGAGIGSCMVANKVPGVRAAHGYDVSSALNSREHNYANFLTLGGGLTGLNLARQIVKTFLNTPYGAERHGRRVAKIMGVERRFSVRSE